MPGLSSCPYQITRWFPTSLSRRSSVSSVSSDVHYPCSRICVCSFVENILNTCLVQAALWSQWGLVLAAGIVAATRVTHREEVLLSYDRSLTSERGCWNFLPQRHGCECIQRPHLRMAIWPFRAYSFCAVFLFRFINRNRNRRVQKERLSFERNNFHGDKMADCLISNWKGKSTKTLYENEIRKKIRATFSTDYLSSSTALSSSFFLVSLRTCIHGYQQEMESCWDAEQSEEYVVVLSAAAAVLRRRRARRRLFSELLTKTRKETKTSMLQQKRKVPTHGFWLYRRTIFDELSGSRLR